MDELKLLIMQMKTDINSKFTSMESRLLQMEEKITLKVNTHMNQKFEGLNRDLLDLRSQIDNQEKRLYHLEKSSVERNLIFFGVYEKEKSYFDLQNSILNIIDQKVGVSIHASQIQSVKRLGIKSEKPRPVSVVFTTLGTKINILKNKKQLVDSGIYINHEFPTSILHKRKELKAELKKELEKGNLAYLKYDKLIIKQKTTENTNKKRQLSLSPTQIGPSTSCQSGDLSTAQSSWEKNYNAKKHRANKNTMMAYINYNNET